MTNTNFSGRVVGDVAILRSVATALPKCSKQGGWWGLMAVGQSGALRSELDRILVVVFMLLF